MRLHKSLRGRPLSGMRAARARPLGVLLSVAVACAQGVPQANKRAGENSAAGTQIYTWTENAPAWDLRLHVSGYRMGCDTGDPDGCLRDAAAEVRERDLTRIFASMDEDPVRSPLDALNFSRLSLSHPYLVEAGFDDFVDGYQNLFDRPDFDPRLWLHAVIQNVKALNPNLAFGITLYEDELNSPYTRPPYLPADLAGNVGYVHLFLHYREDAPNFARYVDQARALFPRAKIIAGLYAYDRIDYIPCSPASKRPCTRDQELDLYRQSAITAAQLLKQGRVAGIEFYPGFFGMEADWDGWKHADYCTPARVKECIANTRTMREATAQILDSTERF